jgi:AcrR family transcriptional regulator
MSLSPQFQDRKSSVAASAFQVLAEGGLEKFSFRAVADTARCSLGRVVHYYPTKQELVLDAIEETGGEMLAGMDAIERRLPANEALDAVLSCALPISETGRAHWRVWTSCWILSWRDRDVGRFVERRNREWRTRLTRLMASATTEEPIRTAEVLSSLVTAGLTGVAMTALRDGLAADAQVSLLRGCLRSLVPQVRDAKLRE